MTFEITITSGDDTGWQPTVGVAAGGVLGVAYTCPNCRGANEIRIQPPAAAGETVETELWCHRCGLGAPVEVRAL